MGTDVLEVLWLNGRLAPDFKTIADFRRDNGPAIKATCPYNRGAPASAERSRGDGRLA